MDQSPFSDSPEIGNQIAVYCVSGYSPLPDGLDGLDRLFYNWHKKDFIKKRLENCVQSVPPSSALPSRQASGK